LVSRGIITTWMALYGSAMKAPSCGVGGGRVVGATPEGAAMTEAEWLACADPFALLVGLPAEPSQRKQRLLVLAACERNPRPFRDIDAAGPLALAGRLADGTADPVERKRERQRLLAGWEQAEWPIAHFLVHTLLARSKVSAARLYYWNVLQLVRQSAYVTERETGSGTPDAGGAEEAEKVALVSDIRDAFGNPFRPAVVDPRWLTETVVALAAGMYEQRAWDRMPILADALEDAGCDSRDLLDHARGPGPHVRGCWVVDLVLGKV
jgi:hypothetical protein